MLYYLTLFLVALAAAVMPDTPWVAVLLCVAGALGAMALFVLVNFNSMVAESVKAKLKSPSKVRHYGMWTAILVPASVVHWFPLVCLLLYFAVESCVYAELME